MDVTLFRNGYNLERRKMYVENPRHNLKSSVDLLWKESLEQNSSNDFSKRKEHSSLMTKESYNKAIEKKIEDELKINRSTFRVMPSPESYQTLDSSRSNYYDSLNKEMASQKSKKTGFQSPIISRQLNPNRDSIQKSVFGYNIDQQAWRRESYLSRILGDRLEPYLKKDHELIPRHQSFTINQPVHLQY